MQQPPVPDDEAQRLALLRACNIIYTPAEQAFDDMAQLAADLCGTEIALITLVDADYQWFKARVGVDLPGCPRDLSFCGHCINTPHPLIVEDTHLDPRFSDNPLVTGEPFLRFYTGIPLLVEPGSSIGALSVADRKPMRLSARQLDSLQRIAKQISRELRLRRDMDPAYRRPETEDLLALPPGTIVGGRWKIAREIGRGAAGAVFEAWDGDDYRVALKVLLPEWRKDEQVIERFVREARVLMSLSTQHVGKLLDVGNLDATLGGLPYLALEFLEGEDLDTIIGEQRAVPLEDALSWCADACDGIAEAHELGIVHRDLKPSNVFLARSAVQHDPVVKVLDFGIAKGDPERASPSRITRQGTIIGSPAYMAPEQILSATDVDPRADIWAMGTILYELLTGTHPFGGETEMQLFANVMTKAPAPFPHAALPSHVEDIVLRCLERDPTRRYPSMPDLSRALRHAG